MLNITIHSVCYLLIGGRPHYEVMQTCINVTHGGRNNIKIRPLIVENVQFNITLLCMWKSVYGTLTLPIPKINSSTRWWLGFCYLGKEDPHFYTCLYQPDGVWSICLVILCGILEQ